MDEPVIGAPAVTPAATETATEEIAQVAPEVTTASPGDPAESTPPAKATPFEQFTKQFDKIAGEPKDDDATESEPKADAAPEKTDEPDAPKAEEQDDDALSQDQEQVKVPEKLTDKPEWQALTKIADKLGPAAGKEARKILRGVFKQQHDLTQALEKAKPAQEVMQEMFESVGGSEVGFNNMRHLIKTYESDPANAVSMLKKLLADAEQRGGLVLQSPELLTEAQQLDQQVEAGTLDKAQADKRKQELLEIQQVRTNKKRSEAQTEQQRQQAAAETTRKQNEAWIAETNQAETNWFNEKTKNDPDFAAVQEVWAAFAQTKALAFVNQNGKRPNGKESVQILEAALKDAKAQAMKFRPKPRAIQAVGGGNGSSGQHRQQAVTEEEKFNEIFDREVARGRK